MTKSKATKSKRLTMTMIIKTGNIKRAAIYIRVSSEKQAEKISPEAQEADCKEYCEQHGYTVVKVYRDTEKYRAGKKLVEPSGTRADRPGLRAMLKDGAAGDFDVIVAWREDRLYRGVNRAMLDVNDLVKDGVISIELVKEHYDPTTAVVKAWAAGVELQAKSDRTSMGIKARLSSGLAWNTPIPFGYTKTDGVYHIDPIEAEWVDKIWTWAGDAVSLFEIRRRLIEGGVRQKSDKHKFTWAVPVIRAILKNDFYFTGVQLIEWNDETFEIPIPVIISPEMAQRVKDRFARFKAYPAGNLKTQALAAGIVYCQACGVRARVMSVKRNGKEYIYYACSAYRREECLDGCFHEISLGKFEADLWARVWDTVSDPNKFLGAIQKNIEALQAQELDASAECERLRREIDAMVMERQQIITWGRKQIISQDDMQYQLGALSIQETGLKHELSEKSLLVGDKAQRLQEVAELYRQDVYTNGALLLAGEPKTEAERQAQFDFRRKLVQGLVKRVDIGADKKIANLDGGLTITANDLCIPEALAGPHWLQTPAPARSLPMPWLMQTRPGAC